MTVAAARVRCLDRGEGEPVLLLHGYPQNHSCWRAQISALAATRRVIAPDWFGWGASERPPGAACDYSEGSSTRAATLIDPRNPR